VGEGQVGIGAGVGRRRYGSGRVRVDGVDQHDSIAFGNVEIYDYVVAISGAHGEDERVRTVTADECIVSTLTEDQVVTGTSNKGVVTFRSRCGKGYAIHDKSKPVVIRSMEGTNFEPRRVSGSGDIECIGHAEPVRAVHRDRYHRNGSTPVAWIDRIDRASGAVEVRDEVVVPPDFYCCCGDGGSLNGKGVRLAGFGGDGLAHSAAGIVRVIDRIPEMRTSCPGRIFDARLERVSAKFDPASIHEGGVLISGSLSKGASP